MEERLIFHVDVNSAFLSWEAARRVKEGLPDLREIPSCIGGDPKSRRGIVVAKSIPAKKYGVTTGEPVALALRKCPDLVCVPGDFALFDRCSRAFKKICASYAPVMESFSIDEVFLDMSGTHLIYPDPVAVAHEIKDKIRDELGFTVNVGIGTNKLLAKMASDFEKPDKVHTLFPSEIPEKMWPLPVRDLLFLGKASEQKLLRAGIKTIGDMAKSDEAEIRQLLGDKNGRQLYRYANGIDDSPVRSEREEAKGYSAETTVEEDIVTYEQALSLLLAQCDVVAARMRRDGKKCSCVAVTYRTLDFKTRSHQKNFEDPTDVTEEIFAQVKKLLYECWKCEPLRLIGVALTDLTSDEFRQMSLFENTEDREKQKKVDETIDDIRRRFGNGMIVRGSTISTAGKVARKARAQLDRDLEGKQER
ncbi:DNA polymerase IV [Desulfotomaculum sp. OF05-3]|uniref:DNA polymerase Y family protein n=1 Tax=Desulfotomaculum sp. OF05-3 TaxID=2305243 RepID=UPI000E420A5E|nr:DNA polymerase IV [Desulfotomaculum sp. OF05-3]MBS5372223.1 DNA polymerase IV [butyrate-producing bacterium]RGE12825.1 DNA polymerase IV [Desulfotomaculum sp. OF05-3]